MLLLPLRRLPLLLLCLRITGAANVSKDSRGSSETDGRRTQVNPEARWAKPKLVGSMNAPEWQPALDLAYLRPPKASRDADRPACELPANSGKYTGVCTEDIFEAPKLIGFCSDIVRYRACIPAHQVMWPNWNATAKDLLLKKLYKDMVERRIAREMNITPDMYVPIRYMSNPECVNSLRNALCWYNFPKCNDVNRSLPLCTSSCNQYYKKCKFPGGPESFPGCAEGVTSARGLFESDVTPGPDQVLAEDRQAPNELIETCQRIASDKEIGITIEEEDPPWYTTWYGIGGLSMAGLAVVAFLAYFLIPPVLMSYLVKMTRRILWFPFRVWMGLPILRGRKVFAVFVLVFLVLLVLGVIQTFSGGFKRWDKWREGGDDGLFQFKPPQFIWGTQAKHALTNQQLRQLKLSCSCTGAALRDHPCLAALVAAAVMPRLLWLVTPTL